MKNITAMKITASQHDLYEAFVDPNKIGNFWFSKSTKRWEAGETVGLVYDEYHAAFDIQVIETIPAQRIVILWGEQADQRQVTFNFEPELVTVVEEDFRTNTEEEIHDMVQNKGGWVYMLSCLKSYLEHGEVISGALIP